MKILNLGSLNIDKVYAVDHIAIEGESLFSRSFAQHLGGKGLNQSIALKKAGADIWHCGAIGKEGVFLKDFLNEAGVNAEFVWVLDAQSGHAIIQVDKNGKNSIIVFGGANQEVDKEQIEKALENFGGGDILLLQNEVSNAAYAISEAAKKGLKIVFNPSPITDDILSYPLDLIDIFILNETEGMNLSGGAGNDEILRLLCQKFPKAVIVLTLGADGAMFKSGESKGFQSAYKVSAIDTTAAGDTFCGYLISCLAKGFDMPNAVKYSCAASALSTTKAGAAESIPKWQEVESFVLSEEEKQ
jgi:ribokinase